MNRETIQVSGAGAGTHAALPTRRVPIDVMRAVSMLYIVGFWHLLDYTKVAGWHYNPVTYRLTVGALSLFVLISGFLTGRTDGGLARGEIWSFYKTRFWRIYLPFVVASGLFLAAGVSDTVTLIKGVTLVGMLLAPPPLTLWFVNMIVLFYLIAPMLIGLRGNEVAYIALCTAIVGAMILYQAATGRIDIRLILYFPCFAAGIFLAARVAAVIGAKSHRPRTSRRSVSRAYAGTSVRELGDRSMGTALGAFRLDRSLCRRHARGSESKTVRDSHAAQRGELLHVPAASSPLSMDADGLGFEYRESAGSLPVVRVSADYRDRRMALPKSVRRILATA